MGSGNWIVRIDVPLHKQHLATAYRHTPYAGGWTTKGNNVPLVHNHQLQHCCYYIPIKEACNRKRRDNVLEQVFCILLTLVVLCQKSAANRMYYVSKGRRERKREKKKEKKRRKRTSHSRVLNVGYIVYSYTAMLFRSHSVSFIIVIRILSNVFR